MKGFTLIFSPTLDFTLPDRTFHFGEYNSVVHEYTDTVNMNGLEVTGILILPGKVGGFEAIYFLLEDGNTKRIGRELDLNHSVLTWTASNFHVLSSRLIGMQAKFYD